MSVRFRARSVGLSGAGDRSNKKNRRRARVASARPKSVTEHASGGLILIVVIVLAVVVCLDLLDLERAEGRGYTGYVFTRET